MNGSDLESDFGLATDDLAEMLDSGLDSRHANVLILTGGTKRWMNDAIPENECIIWQLSDGWLNEVDSMGKINMGNPDTLRDFMLFCMDNYPAEKYGLIMWDHGGGSIAGFGHDEKFDNSSLTLPDMRQAFEEVGLRENKLEFMGFDACLMATVEMAVLAADYARVLIAAEDLEPGEGWDYHFLGVLNDDPHMDGFELGKVIVDTFMDFYGPDSDEILTLSVVDLEHVTAVMDAMGALMTVALKEMEFTCIETTERSLPADTHFQTICDYRTSLVDERGFYALAKRRGLTKTFGEGSPRDNYADMVDIGDMAVQLRDLFPREAEAVLQALQNSVVYNRHNSDIELWGLSTFYIYGGKSMGIESLEIYSELGMDNYYTQYLHEFFQNLKGRDRTPIIREEFVLWEPVSPKRQLDDVSAREYGERTFRMVGLFDSPTPTNYPKINGHPVVLYPIATTENTRKYAIPARINNREVDIIVSISQNNYNILGSRNRIEHVFQKGHDLILPGDEIAIYYLEKDFSTTVETWVMSEKFMVRDNLQIEWETVPPEYRLGYRFTDVCNNVSYVLQ